MCVPACVSVRVGVRAWCVRAWVWRVLPPRRLPRAVSVRGVTVPRGHPGARPAGRSAWRVRRPHTWARRRLSRSHPLRPPPPRAGISGGAVAAPCLLGAGGAQLSGPGPPQTRTALRDATAALVAPVTASRPRPRLPRRPRVGQPRVPALPRSRVPASGLGVGSRAPARVCTSARVSVCTSVRARPAPQQQPRTNLDPSTPCPRARPRAEQLAAPPETARGCAARAGGDGRGTKFVGSPGDFPRGPACVRVRGPGSAELVPWLPGQWAPDSRPPFTPPQWFV